MIGTKMPEGLTEAEEAQWHFEEREALAERYLAASAGQNPQLSYAARRFNLKPSLELEREDVDLARRQADEAGLTLQQYAADLFHEAVQARELRKAS